MRILLLFLFTGLSFVANGYLRQIPTIVWYFMFVNSFVFILFFVNFLRLKGGKSPVGYVRLYYFSGIGGVFGGFFMMILSGFFGLKRTFIVYQFAILIVWCIGFVLLFELYAPFEKIVRNLF